MISGIDLTQTIEFTIPGDESNPTIWKLGMIPSGVLASLGESAKNSPIQVAFKMLRVGLKGWTNFSGVDFKTEVDPSDPTVQMVPMELINRIPLNAVLAISDALVKVNHLSDTERKN